ncbi:MAG TPA: DUF4115 domain-containing protein [Acidobacteriota bacterium]|nr:DUF4115 domain-containing protein [Acidobacteriota bacterium]HNT17087.1 DUF4115 domain-containing protein [Acidobacteriota bacterium]HPA26099.1 DUF4115 domain-containing protein [Acidobacteriota bacterium]HQO19268.1 DUF4115 domain-containing protein [Acidobacteriota bacterium]HQQ46080.1 DUF4115 domain-containing protein [Acidobacteriota bacterium]
MNDGLKAFGRRLKELADEKGVPVEELSKATKIRAFFIESIFRGRREDLPDDIFVVGYVKALLDHLRVDPGPWIEEYRALTKPEPLAEQDPRESSFTPVPPIRTGSHLIMWTLLVLAILACSGIYLFRISPADIRGRLLGSHAGSPDPAKTAAALESVPGKKGHDSGASVLPPPAAEKEREGEAAPVAGREKKIVTADENLRGLLIRASAPCWIELKGDGGRVLLKREVAGGESLVFPGRKFVISVGDSSAVDVVFDGKAVEIEKAPGKVIRNVELGGGAE